MTRNEPATQLTLKAFQAPSEPDLCDEFIREHHQVLADFNIPQAVAPDNSWRDDPDSHVIVALHPELGMVGGIRLQLAREGKPLPMESAISKMDPRIHDALAPFVEDGIGEVCGLWNANRYSSKGVPVLLSTAVTAIATIAGARRMTCFVAHYTQKHPATNGFLPMTDVGEQGSFHYPVPRIRSIVMLNPDTVLLPHATSEQRHRIFSLRLRPIQSRTEQPAGVPLNVDYLIQVDPKLVDITPYFHIELDRLRAAS